MANMSPMGAFASGIAGGIESGMANYIKGMNEKIDKQEKQDMFKMNQAFKFFTDENLPVAIRKQAYKVWQDLNKNWNTGLTPPDFSDEYWSDKKLTPFFKKGLGIMKNDDYTDKEKATFLRELDIEIADSLGLSPKERLENIQTNIKGEQTAGAFSPRAGQPSPLMTGFTGAYGKEAAGGIGAATQAGVPMHEAAAMFPKKKTVAPPTTPMFTDKQLESGAVQKMQYNPQTREYDKPFGKPKTAKDGQYFRLGNSYYQVVGGRGKLIQKGSVDEQSVMNAMREFGWSMMSEPDKIESVAMHKRILLGQGKKPGKKIKLTREMAVTLLEAAGGDKAKAREMARQQGYSF